MNKLSPTSYKALFFKHVYRFLGNVTSPMELTQKHVIAVSGGVDSMALLWVAYQLMLQEKIGAIRVVFVHHHTREGQDLDAQLVSDFCHQYGLPFEILHALGLNSEAGNFEGSARKIRRELLLGNLNKDECLWLGHHVDDSYEWSLMQRYKSSQPKSSLGIPVRNGKIVRPFLCVTKKQIRQFAQYENILFREDPTNGDIKYDRNYLRKVFIPLLQKRYPQYLKHYVNHANYLAAILHLSITNRINGNRIHVYDQGAIIEGSQFSQYQVQDVLQSFSNTDRGEVSVQIQRMFKAIDNGKKGPFHFSGGTEIYHTYKLLMIYQQNMKNHDEMIAKVLGRISEEELKSLPLFKRRDLERSWENLTKQSDAMLNMPGLILIVEPKNICKTLNASVFDTLFPAVSEICQNRDFRFITTLKCLEMWKLKKNRLPEKLRLLPLWTLSNVFASQE